MFGDASSAGHKFSPEQKAALEVFDNPKLRKGIKKKREIQDKIVARKEHEET